MLSRGSCFTGVTRPQTGRMAGWSVDRISADPSSCHLREACPIVTNLRRFGLPFLYGAEYLFAASLSVTSKLSVVGRQIWCEPMCYCFWLCRVYRAPVRLEV